MVQSQIFHWGRCTSPWVLWSVNKTAPKSLWTHTGDWFVCVYASWSITDWTDLPIWSSGYWSSLWSRSLHSQPLGVFCSLHAVPSLLVTELLWSANQIKRRRSQRTNRQHRMCYFFPLSLCLCLWMSLDAYSHHFVKLFNTLLNY